MSKTILTDIEGWTPTIDAVIDDLDLLSSVVFGRVWRYCQMEDGICRATIEKIADGCGLSRRTVERRLEKLCGTGYLKDLTPDRRNAPHVYADTGKAGLQAVIRATSESRTGTSESHSGYVRESHEESKEESEEESDILYSADADFPESSYKPGPGQIVSCEDPDTGEEVGEEDWRSPSTQLQAQAFCVCGRSQFYSKAERNKLERIEAMLETGKLPEEFWKNRLWAAEQYQWSLPKLLKYSLDPDKLREWEARQ